MDPERIHAAGLVTFTPSPLPPCRAAVFSVVSPHLVGGCVFGSEGCTHTHAGRAWQSMHQLVQKMDENRLHRSHELGEERPKAQEWKEMGMGITCVKPHESLPTAP
jgi:hypothetical protein